MSKSTQAAKIRHGDIIRQLPICKLAIVASQTVPGRGGWLPIAETVNSCHKHESQTTPLLLVWKRAIFGTKWCLGTYSKLSSC
jgi:hypothetical protein